ncbi:MAG: hypothetical protein RLY20_2948 [Verrucomicrobiota bacterium]|jgi:hypothetical protein
MSALGYHYPAGAEHDPRAPWNQEDDCAKTKAEMRLEWTEDKADMERDEA